MVYQCFDKMSKGSDVNIEVKHNEQLAEELHKPLIRSLNKTVYLRFKDNIWGADLAVIQLISNFNIIKDLGFYYVSLIFLINMLGLFL